MVAVAERPPSAGTGPRFGAAAATNKATNKGLVVGAALVTLGCKGLELRRLFTHGRPRRRLCPRRSTTTHPTNKVLPPLRLLLLLLLLLLLPPLHHRTSPTAAAGTAAATNTAAAWATAAAGSSENSQIPQQS